MTQRFKDKPRQAQNGSFTGCVQVFVERLRHHGYAAASVKISTRLVKDFAAWLDQRGIEGQSLSAKHVADYLDVRWRLLRRRRGDAFTLHSFGRLVAPDAYKASCEQEAAIAPALRVRQDFERYLLRERGLAAASIRLYGDSVGRFLENAFGDAEVRLDQLKTTDDTQARGVHAPLSAACVAGRLPPHPLLWLDRQCRTKSKSGACACTSSTCPSGYQCGPA